MNRASGFQNFDNINYSKKDNYEKYIQMKNNSLKLPAIQPLRKDFSNDDITSN
jgi:hypothetical protein